MNPCPQSSKASKSTRESHFSLETIIAMSLFGWLALSVTLMGLGIW